MSGCEWSTYAGVYCEHGNHTAHNCGSQTLYQYYHFGIQPHYTFVYTGGEYFRNNEPGIFSNALSTVEFWQEYDCSLHYLQILIIMTHPLQLLSTI